MVRVLVERVDVRVDGLGAREVDDVVERDVHVACPSAGRGVIPVGVLVRASWPRSRSLSSAESAGHLFDQRNMGLHRNVP